MQHSLLGFIGRHYLQILFWLALLSTLNPQLSTARAQGTAFTYQGRLNDGASPANGNYDLRFTIYDSSTGGLVIGGPITNAPTAVSNGLFTVTVDFGAGVFTGSARWLEIGVRTNGSAGVYQTLSPRQPLTATPYSVTAGNVTGLIPGGSLSGSYPGAVTFNNGADMFAGAFSGNGGGLTNVNAATVGGLGTANFWQTGGNAGTSPNNSNFVGTRDFQPLELWVNQSRALRLEPVTNNSGAPNVIGGAPNNAVAPGVIGATIAGGGALNQNISSFLPGPSSNYVSAIFGTIGGGRLNTVGADHGTIAGGLNNSIQAYSYDSAIGGGSFNLIASGLEAVIAGGNGNTIAGGDSNIGGGQNNAIQPLADHSAIGGGGNNTIVGSVTLSVYDTIGGGYLNAVLTNTTCATIAGGISNSVSLSYAFVGGGESNSCGGQAATVVGGYNNSATGTYSAIGGGAANSASGADATVPGGSANTAAGIDSFAAGSGAQALHNSTFVWSDGTTVFPSTANNQFLIQAANGVGIGTNAPQAQLYVSSPGGNYFPQAQVDQQNLSDYARLRFTVGGNGVKRWDVGATWTNFLIWSGTLGAPMLNLDQSGLTVHGTFVSSSDRNLKAGFEPVDAKSILERVTALPITRWHYTNDISTPHLGPVAQDFYAAFNLGKDDKHIATVDEGGVALAAIQGLNQKLNEKDAEIADLKARLEKLEQLINSIKGNNK